MRHSLIILFALFSIVLSGQWVDTTWRYQDTTRFITEKYPKYGDWNKPTSLNDPSLVAAYNMIPSAGGVLTDIPGNGNNGAINGAISSVDGLVFDGTDDNVVIGNVGNVKSISFRIKPISTTEKILEGAANDKLIHINSGTLTYSDYDDAYVDGVNANTIVANQWQNVTVVSSTDVDNTALTLALNNTTYGNFEIADLQLYSIELTEQQAKDYHNSFAKRVILTDNFEYDAVGTSQPLYWIPGTGIYELKELTAQDAVLKELDIGTKYLECTTAGTIAIPNSFAYGTPEFYFYQGGASNDIYIFPISTRVDPSISNGYRFRVISTEALQLRRNDNGVYVDLFGTAASYISSNTWYGAKLPRTKDGEFVASIKGGAFGNIFTLINVTGGSGSNPVTDNNHKSNNYLVLDFDVGDGIILKSWLEGVIQ